MIVELFILLLTFYIGFVHFRSRKNLPPGPWQLPILGGLPLTENSQCIEMQKKYGNIFKTRTGCINTIYIADYKIVKEAFSQIAYSDRPVWSVLQITDHERRIGNVYGVINSNGEQWHHTRRYLLRHLRDLGMGKSKMEGIILREVEYLVEDFKSLTETPSKLPFTINLATLNIIWQLVAGYRYDFTNKKVEEFMDKMHQTQKSIFRALLVDFLPFVNYLFPSRFLDYVLGRKRFERSYEAFKNMIQPYIDEHLKKLDPNNPQDLMDDYLIEMTEKKSREFSHFCNEDLLRNTMDLFFAGNDTTASMTQWVLLYMAKFPDVQKKIQNLLDDVVQPGTFPGLEQREHLAYLDATINEVQRHCTMLPFGVFRATNTDVNLRGFHIPKGSVVSPLAGIIHKDPNYWENPEEFNPSRFLDSNGQFIPQTDGFLPFGVGKRQCIGEQFARMELYLILGALLYKFTFEPSEGNTIDLTPAKFPTLHMPNTDQKLRIQMRH